MRLKICIFLVQCIIFCIQYDNVTAKAIVGNNVRRVREREFSFVVFIEEIGDANDPNPENYHLCTGTLVSKTNVLTAAHCYKDRHTNDIVIIVGSTDLRYGRSYYPTQWITYDEWAALRNIQYQLPLNDIAMTKLAESVPGDISPVQLTSRTNIQTYGLRSTTIGLGVLENNNIDNFMTCSYVNVLSHRDCENKIRREIGQRVDVAQNFLCTVASPYTLLTKGDSGGPLLYNGVLIGINKGTCLYPELTFHPNKINIHLSVDYYRNFIEDTINNF